MTSTEKIEYMLHKVRERARISPAGFFYVDCAPIIDIDANGGIPDGASEILSRADQVSILQKFQSDNLLFGIEFEKDYKGAWVAIMNLDIESEENPYERPAKVENKTKHLDLEKGVLWIRGNEIKVSGKSGKENYPIALIKTLTKEPNRAWYRDEILEDWEGRELSKTDLKRHSRTKVYAAAKTLNSKILEQANMRDFLVFDTNKFQINPEYVNGS